MTFQSRARSRDHSAKSGYPRLSTSTAAALNRELVGIVALLHGDSLTDAQREELAASVANQVRNTEKLHEFPLSNADEPAFVAALNKGMSHD